MSGYWPLMRRYCCIMGVCCARALSFMAAKATTRGRGTAGGCSLTFMTTDQALFALAERVGGKLRNAGRRFATAESCTGGWVAKVCTHVAGSSHWLGCRFVTYSSAEKVRDIGVSEDTLANHGAVSEAIVREMAAGALRVSGADAAVAVSGIAGPDGGTPTKPVGTVWFGMASRGGSDVAVIAEVRIFDGDRDLVRRRSV